ncbi:MAG TPA: exodeoxyribonuclease VII large subunit [Xanthobacteraceae bacterium]|nr:exodeoxyribonuclease VII large subunit [Xanthobacteraceae bacterium]
MTRSRITAEIDAETGAPLANVPEWSVSELSSALKKTVEDAYGYVRVRGEISGYRGPSPSGHVYFRLKDDKAVLESVIWKTSFGRMRIKPEEGLDVIVSGRLTTFAGSSKYQIVIDMLEPAGAGALMALLEERKKKLAAEGLFDEARKQLLPFLPEVIGVVTSPTGAVIRDILHRLADRFPRHVLVWPVKVQGENSAAEVAAAIEGFNALPERAAGLLPRRPDLIIVARGGGSLEDLWSFNEEIVVRAVAASFIPLISAVGHETDVTLIDFASDKRAPTPTAAAEMAVPVRADLLLNVDSFARRALACWRRCQEARWSELRSATRALPNADEVLAVPRQRLDQASSRLSRALHANAQIHRVDFSRIGGRLSPQLLRTNIERRRERYGGLTVRLRVGMAANIQVHHARIARERERVTAFGERARRAVRQSIAVRQARAERGAQLLAAFSYRGVLARGFALVRDAAGRPLHTAAAVGAGMPIEIEFADGRVGARAEGVALGGAPSPDKPSGPAAKLRPRSGGSGQGNLF